MEELDRQPPLNACQHRQVTPCKQHPGRILEIWRPLLVKAAGILCLPTQTSIILPGLEHPRLEVRPCHPLGGEDTSLRVRLLRTRGEDIGGGEVGGANSVVDIVVGQLYSYVGRRIDEGDV